MGRFVKRSLCVFLALLKPIIEIPKIITVPALLEIIKVVAEFAVLHRFVVVASSFVREVICRCNGRVRVVVVVVVGIHGRSVSRGCWRPFFRQSNAGGKRTRLRTLWFRLWGIGCLHDHVRYRVCSTELESMSAWDITVARCIGV